MTMLTSPFLLLFCLQSANVPVSIHSSGQHSFLQQGNIVYTLNPPKKAVIHLTREYPIKILYASDFYIVYRYLIDGMVFVQIKGRPIFTIKVSGVNAVFEHGGELYVASGSEGFDRPRYFIDRITREGLTDRIETKSLPSLGHTPFYQDKNDEIVRFKGIKAGVTGIPMSSTSEWLLVLNLDRKTILYYNLLKKTTLVPRAQGTITPFIISDGEIIWRLSKSGKGLTLFRFNGKENSALIREDQLNPRNVTVRNGIFFAIFSGKSPGAKTDFVEVSSKGHKLLVKTRILPFKLKSGLDFAVSKDKAFFVSSNNTIETIDLR